MSWFSWSPADYLMEALTRFSKWWIMLEDAPGFYAKADYGPDTFHFYGDDDAITGKAFKLYNRPPGNTAGYVIPKADGTGYDIHTRVRRYGKNGKLIPDQWAIGHELAHRLGNLVPSLTNPDDLIRKEFYR